METYIDTYFFCQVNNVKNVLLPVSLIWINFRIGLSIANLLKEC